MKNVPDFLTHYYDSERSPFLNLISADDSVRERIISDLNSLHASGRSNRAFPGWYMSQRRKAEDKIKELFIQKGGTAELNAPYYFTLGESDRWVNTYFDRTRSVKVKLIEDHPEVLYSIGDSVWCFAESEDPTQSWTNQWFQGKLYTRKEVNDILESLNIDLNVPGSLTGKRIGYIEAFVWSDRVLKELLMASDYSFEGAASHQ